VPVGRRLTLLHLYALQQVRQLSLQAAQQ